MEESLFLERSKEIEVSRSGFLPHWEKTGKLQFVTFRLIDSLPVDVVAELSRQKKQFIALNPKPWDENTTKEFLKIVTPFETTLLDAGYGSCMLRLKSVRRIVEENLHFHDNVKYKLLAYVIMPNHVHLLLAPLDKLPRILHSIKSYTSHEINEKFGREGALWQKEYYDRIIRNEAHLDNVVTYICQNPANLPQDNYSLYVNRALIAEILS